MIHEMHVLSACTMILYRNFDLSTSTLRFANEVYITWFHIAGAKYNPCVQEDSAIRVCSVRTAQNQL